MAILLAVSTAMFLAFLDTTVVNIAMPAIQSSLGTDVVGLAWVVDAYTLALAALMLSGGILADRFGAAAVFGCGMGVFALASAGCGLAPDLGTLILARFLQGAGAALFIPASMAIFRHVFAAPAERARAFGVWASAGATAMAIGPALGGLMVEHVGWRSVFLINLPPCLLSLAAAAWLMPRPPRSTDRGLDPLGQLCGIAALAGLTVLLVEAPARGVTSAPVIAAAAVAVLAGAAFLRAQAVGKAPLVPLNLFTSAGFNAVTLGGLLNYFGYLGAIFVISLYLQQGLGLSPVAAGLSMSPLAAVFAVTSIVAGRLVPRLGMGRQMVVGLAGAAIGFLGFIPAVLTGWPALLWPAMVISGACQALALAPMNTAALHYVPPEYSGVGAALTFTARQIGALLGVAVYAAVTLAVDELSRAAILATTLSAAAYLVAAVLVARHVDLRS